MYNFFFKRILDFLFALLGLVVLSPLLLMVTLALYFANQGKPFFFQSCPGLNGTIFKIIKFKTMNDKLDSEGNLLPDSERITKMGKFV
jgi:lipopolysaccharide/colanic/teichoic acid biosynthesis glycosyltransferase